MPAIIERFRVPLAWGLLVTLFLVAGSAVLVPLLGAQRDLNAGIARGYETLARLKAIASSAEETRARAQRMTQEDVAGFVFADAVDGDDLTLRLRKLVDESVTRTGVQLTSVDNIRAQSGDGVSRAGVLVRARGDIEGIVELLRDLEAFRPLLLVDDVEMRPGRSRRSRREPADTSQEIMVTLRVFGFFLERPA